jgi:hypothetical protein
MVHAPFGAYHLLVANTGVSGGYRSVAEQQANAKLISAAPDLLDACQAVLLRLDLEESERPGTQYPNAAMRDTLRAAIAKATGEA